MKASFAVAVCASGIAALACGDDGPSAPALVPLTFTATLDADSIRPTPVDAPASGTGSFSVTTGTSPFFDPGSDARKIITYSLTVGGLSGEATQVHIHGPADASASGDILVPLRITSTDSVGVISNGTFTATTNAAVSMDSLVTLLTRGNAYVDVHTTAFPNGEIRGQLRGR